MAFGLKCLEFGRLVDYEIGPFIKDAYHCEYNPMSYALYQKIEISINTKVPKVVDLQ